ncbi:hypothetical protein [Methanolobus vulcani]|uniref:Uncharacterized protein n=1 Tax=Methanolobus vulcani TaxID=38026 RepID=A0A7Z8KRU1_9EURY|nr:hypothetical protein [Methanolobus vulcani]TQD28254.1 hypothetical protein FKV42_00865 [Methanolobus vulcani]
MLALRILSNVMLVTILVLSLIETSNFIFITITIDKQIATEVITEVVGFNNAIITKHAIMLENE